MWFVPVSFVVSVDGMEGSHEFLLIDDFSGRHGQWVKTNSFTTIDDGKLFAPGNLRGTQVSLTVVWCVTAVTAVVRLSNAKVLGKRLGIKSCASDEQTHVGG